MRNLVLLGLYILSFTQCNGQQLEESIVLLPEGYTGPVAIIFSQKEGVEPMVENGKHVYEIPSSGILRTTVEANMQIAGHEYYYVSINEERIPIEYLLPKGLENIGRTLSESNLNENANYIAGEEMSGLSSGSRVRLFVAGKVSEMETLGQEKYEFLFKLE